MSKNIREEIEEIISHETSTYEDDGSVSNEDKVADKIIVRLCDLLLAEKEKVIVPSSYDNKEDWESMQRVIIENKLIDHLVEKINE